MLARSHLDHAFPAPDGSRGSPKATSLVDFPSSDYTSVHLHGRLRQGQKLLLNPVVEGRIRMGVPNRLLQLGHAHTSANLVIASALAIASALVSPLSVHAATLTVCASGCTFSTVQAALAAAQNGDEIDIGTGTYAGGITVGKSVSLLGAGSGLTVLSGGGPVVTVVSGVNASVTGMTITGGNTTGFGGGIANSGTAAIRNVDVARNVASSGGGGVVNFGSMTITDSVIRQNQAGGNGQPGGKQGGGGAFNAGSFVSKNVAMIGNTANSPGGGIRNFGSMTVTNGLITGNQTTVNGGGFSNAGGATFSLVGSIVGGNQATAGSGGGAINTGNLTVSKSTFTRNTATAGGAILDLGSVTMTESSIVGNTATVVGGGIVTELTLASFSLMDTTVVANVAPYGGGIAFDLDGTLSLTDSTVIANRASQQGGGIFIQVDIGGGTATLTHSKVAHNTPDNCFPPGSISSCLG